MSIPSSPSMLPIRRSRRSAEPQRTLPLRLTLLSLLLVLLSVLCEPARAFSTPSQANGARSTGKEIRSKRQTLLNQQLQEEDAVLAEDEESRQREKQKRELLGLLGKIDAPDPVLADPMTRQPLVVSAPGILFGADRQSKRKLRIDSPTNRFSGSSDTFLDLLKPETYNEPDRPLLDATASIQRALLPLVPPFLRGAVAANLGGSDGDFVPMRDLFTSPAVSYAYERGWRSGFARAGFPGPDVEATMAMDYFAPSVAGRTSSVVVDMSCATGLFTRRFAASDKYARVIGCDYSESMLAEARRRIQSEPQLASRSTQLDLVRCDVGKIPMQDASVDALHAGAAMHCWPDLDAAAMEIYRVLKPGGRYFATTFLSSYFSTLQSFGGPSGGGDMDPSRQAFQYFESVDTLRSLMERGGFGADKIAIEVLSPACVVIRCEK